MATEADQSRSDEALITAIQSGDSEAFTDLLERHVHHVRAFLALRAPVAHLVDELTHETFVFAFRNIQSFKPESSAPAWLRAIAWNLLRAEVQRFSRAQANQKRLAGLYICELAQSTSEEQASQEMEFLLRCLEQTSASVRQLLTLKYQQDHPSEEIARRLERSVAWVHTTLFRARRQLRQCIEQKLGSQRS
jgi:RNA polymerase sigma-70 factor (ECF subfamily)